MEKWRQIKKKHHYVWEFYLKNWSVDGRVYWVTSKGNVAFDSPKGMCREDGFYKIHALDKDDIQYIRKWSLRSPELIQKQHEKRLMQFIQISEMIRVCSTQPNEHEELKQIEATLQYNSLENMYCGVERGAKAAIEGLSKGDVTVLDDKNPLIGLYSYLGHQIMRTKGLRDRFFEYFLKKIPPSKARDEDYRLTDKNWWFLCYILGENIGCSLFTSRHEDKFIFVKNDSELTFITGDSPVVNIHPKHDEVQKGEPTEFLDIYFPVSPRYALMINTSSKWDYLYSGANINDVIELNSRVASNSRFSVYGCSKDVIQMCKNNIKHW